VLIFIHRARLNPRNPWPSQFAAAFVHDGTCSWKLGDVALSQRKAPFNDFSRRKGTWDNEVATTGLQHYQRQRGNPSVARCHRESTGESEVTNDN
jgi:hypothetical protein